MGIFDFLKKKKKEQQNVVVSVKDSIEKIDTTNIPKPEVPKVGQVLTPTPIVVPTPQKEETNKPATSTTKPTTSTIKPATNNYYKRLYVILDNGHGENTPGKRSPDGRLREYAYCRQIVNEIGKRLDKLSIDWYRLVPETIDISLTERVKRANKIYKEQVMNGKVVILISVHCNAAGNGEWKNARGWSAWTSVGKTKGDDLATCLYKAAHEILDKKSIKVRTDKSDGDEDWESNFTIITKSTAPAVLTENFFQDNKEDVEYLLSDEGKKDVVNIHVNGIKKYADFLFKK